MTELMKRYEAETGKIRPEFNLTNIHALLYWYQMFAEWLEADNTRLREQLTKTQAELNEYQYCWDE